MGAEQANATEKKEKKRRRDNAEEAEDTFLPVSNIARVMKKALHSDTVVARETIEAVQVFLSEMVMVVVGEATQHSLDENRRAIRAEDILWALRQLGMEVYNQPLNEYLHAYQMHPTKK
uniref:Transcription factor CBF/NF-Y/archaeal histone domain-containing protein n=1 Tax=Guillardia theta TaxID=55529 RepID=A0A7S4PAK6_GUITH